MAPYFQRLLHRTTVFTCIPSLALKAATGVALVELAATPLLMANSSSLLVAPARAQSNNQQILLASYADTKAAYDKIIPLFEADWKKKTG